MSDAKSVVFSSGSLAVSINFPQEAFVHSAKAAGVFNDVASSDAVTQALMSPLGLPRLHDCVVDGDRVVIVADPQTPSLLEIITQVMEAFQSVENDGVSVTILLPADPRAESWKELVTNCPVHMQGKITLVIHDPGDSSQCGYLASSAAGNRVYLNKHLLDADLVVSIGTIGFDSQLGYRGTSSVIFPAFSDRQTIREFHGSGHPELTPDERRPMRDLIDEIGWLLGTQFAVQVIPAEDGTAGRILAGMPSEVQQVGQDLLDKSWRMAVDEPAELVVLSIPCALGAQTTADWRNLGLALEMASRITSPSGRIAIVADLAEPEGPAAGMLRRTAHPEELLKPLRREPTEDAFEITQLILACERATVYLLSHLPDEVVEEMGMFALGAPGELQKLVDSCKRSAAVPGANLAWCDLSAMPKS